VTVVVGADGAAPPLGEQEDTVVLGDVVVVHAHPRAIADGVVDVDRPGEVRPEAAVLVVEV
jgi:hypothetical protein